MDMLDDVEFKVTKLDLGPDDILAVRVGTSISAVTAAELTARLERRLSLEGRVLVLDPGAELTVVARKDVSASAQSRFSKR